MQKEYDLFPYLHRRSFGAQEELSKKVEETISNISPKKKLHTIDNDEKSVESHYKLYNEILN